MSEIFTQLAMDVSDLGCEWSWGWGDGVNSCPVVEFFLIYILT